MTITDHHPRVHVPTDSPPRRSPWAWVLLGVLLAAVTVSALWLVAQPTGSDQPTATPNAVAPAPPPAAPALNNAAPIPDWTVVVNDIVTFDNWLRVHPDPARVDEYLHPSNSEFAEVVDAQERLASGDLRYDPLPGPVTVGSVELIAHTGNTATVQVTYTSTPRWRVVDRAGNVVVDTPAGRGNAALWSLRYDGAWRLAADEVL